MGLRGKVPAIWEKTDLRYLNNSLTNKKVRKVKLLYKYRYSITITKFILYR